MLLVCIFSIIILGLIIVKRPRTIIWMGRYIRNKLLFIIIIIGVTFLSMRVSVVVINYHYDKYMFVR